MAFFVDCGGLFSGQPMCRWRSAGQNFVQARPRGEGCSQRKLAHREKACLGDFSIRATWRALMKMSQHHHYNMVAAREAVIKENSMPLRRRIGFDMSLFAQFTLQGLAHSLASFDAAAWKMPARHISMAHEKHSRLIIQHDPLNTQRYGARDPKPNMAQMAQSLMQSFAETHVRDFRNEGCQNF